MNNNFIPTKKKRTKYKFITRTEPNLISSNDNLFFFYQICTFPNYKNRFQMRKFIINDNNEFVSVKTFNLTKKQCKKFYAEKKTHQYKNYSTYSLDEINTPSLGDILTAKSQILSSNNSEDYSSFAPF